MVTFRVLSSWSGEAVAPIKPGCGTALTATVWFASRRRHQRLEKSAEELSPRPDRHCKSAAKAGKL